MKVTTRFVIIVVVLLIMQNIGGLSLERLLVKRVYADTNLSVNLKWVLISEATGYEIYRDGIKIGTIETNSYSDTAITEDNTYTYMIKASKGGNELIVSNPVTVSTFDEQVPLPPTNLKASSVGTTYISISWDSAVNPNKSITMEWVKKNQNLALGKSYTKPEPEGEYPDSNNESTDGILAKNFMDGNSYGYKVPLNTTRNVDVIINLGVSTSLNDIKIHRWEGVENYEADTISIYTSKDGINFDFVGSPNKADNIWFDLSFSAMDAKFIKVSFSKYNSGAWGNDWLFIDEIEIYNDYYAQSTNLTNLAFGKSYTRPEPEGDYPDSNNESTDGILAKDYMDGNSYGYKVPLNTTKSVDVIINLGVSTALNNIRVHKWEGSNHYGADIINIYASQDGINYKLIECKNRTVSAWDDFNFSTITAQYIKVNFNKSNNGEDGYDWLFVDEIETYRNQTIIKDTSSSYDIEVDGIINDNGTSKTYVNYNLEPNSQHTFRVREKIAGVISDWSPELKVKTSVGPDTPPKIITIPKEESMPEPAQNITLRPTETGIPDSKLQVTSSSAEDIASESKLQTTSKPPENIIPVPRKELNNMQNEAVDKKWVAKLFMVIIDIVTFGSIVFIFVITRKTKCILGPIK